MTDGLLTGPVQVAYHVPDIRRAALEAYRDFGAGPFFVIDGIRLAEASHRGRPSSFVHSSAYGQSGEMMLELVSQDDDQPSPFRDLYGPEETGIHHVAYFANDLQMAIDHLADQGMPLATRARTITGQAFVFVDATARLGHLIELYEPGPGLLNFYAMVRESAEGWQGDAPLRSPS
jgi:hypothetical protein